MQPELFESLLHQNESETLDFKVAQYPFEKATEEQKGELLKDILAFANAWRQSDAYILIGVEEVRDGRSIPRGVDLQLINRNLQQFVDHKTNRPIAFSYSSIKADGVDVGILTIPHQERPLYLLKNFGKLKANVVYIRRSDTTAEAKPDEVARMGNSSQSSGGQPVLDFEFVNPETRERYGTHADLISTVAELPQTKAFPLYGEPKRTQWGLSVDPTDFLRNRNFYRDFADYFRERQHLCAVGFALNNTSTTVAEDAVVTLTVKAEGLSMVEDNQLPQEPSSTNTYMGKPSGPLHAQRVEVARYGDSFQIRALIGNIPPGTTGWAVAPVWIGARESSLFDCSIEIAANNLRLPIRTKASLQFEAKILKITLAELKAYADSKA